MSPLSPPARTAWIVMTVLAIGVAGYALASLVLPGVRPAFIVALFAASPLAAPAHLGGGALALAVGAWQIHPGFREQYRGAHRMLGRLYVASVAAGGAAAFTLAIRTHGGSVAQIGFGLLAVAWVGTTLIAVYHIRSSRQPAHRAWMIRSYALTLSAVTLRVYLPLSQVSGVPFESAYMVIAWACWVPNLLIAEWYLRPPIRAQPSPFTP